MEDFQMEEGEESEYDEFDEYEMDADMTDQQEQVQPEQQQANIPQSNKISISMIGGFGGGPLPQRTPQPQPFVQPLQQPAPEHQFRIQLGVGAPQVKSPATLPSQQPMQTQNAQVPQPLPPPSQPQIQESSLQLQQEQQYNPFVPTVTSFTQQQITPTSTPSFKISIGGGPLSFGGSSKTQHQVPAQISHQSPKINPSQTPVNIPLPIENVSMVQPAQQNLQTGSQAILLAQQDMPIQRPVEQIQLVQAPIPVVEPIKIRLGGLAPQPLPQSHKQAQSSVQFPTPPLPLTTPIQQQPQFMQPQPQMQITVPQQMHPQQTVYQQQPTQQIVPELVQPAQQVQLTDQLMLAPETIPIVQPPVILQEYHTQPELPITQSIDSTAPLPIQVTASMPVEQTIIQPFNQSMPPLMTPDFQQPHYPTSQQQPQPTQDFAMPQQVSSLQQPADYHPEHVMMPPVTATTIKPSKDRKKRKLKGKGDLQSLYDLSKVKVTLQLYPEKRELRGQAVYKLNLKAEEEVQALLEPVRQEGLYKKYQYDLRFHAKRLNVTKIAVIKKPGDTEEMKQEEKVLSDKAYEYPKVQEAQADLQQAIFAKLSRDLISFEDQELNEYIKEEEQPMLLAKKIISVSFKKENIIDQLPKELSIVVQYNVNKITDFGIRAINYKVQDSLDGISNSSRLSTYFITSDLYNNQQLWMPIVQGHKFNPINWSFKYVVPKDFTVIASGILADKYLLEDDKTLYHYKLDVAAPATKLGFIIGQFPCIQPMQDLSMTQQAHAFFMSEHKLEKFTTKNNHFEKSISAILQYMSLKLINAPYPFKSLKIVFVPNLFLSTSKKQSVDFTGGLHILDEELLFDKTQPEGIYPSYKALASSLAFDFFGGKAYEESPEDFWLLQGIRESIGNQYKISRFGILLHRYHIMKTIESVYQKSKHGFERYPVNSDSMPNHNEYMLNELVYEKSELIMHMIESMIDKSYFEKIIRELYQQSTPMVSLKLFMKIFKQVCGFKLKQFAANWIFATSCPKITVSYQYNKKNNSLDLTLQQESAIKDYFLFKKYISDNLKLGQLLVQPFVRKDPFNLTNESDAIKASLKQLDAMDDLFVEYRRRALKLFVGEVNVMLYLTDGADISTQQQKMSLKANESQVSINIPLNVKVKKTIQNKKKEYESMQMHEGDEDGDEDASMDNSSGMMQKAAHIIDNNSWKFGMHDFELEAFPINTKNLFDVKILDSSVLWIRVDPDMEFIRKVKVNQESNNWLFQLLLEKDIIGQIEAIKQLYKQNTQQQFVYEILQSVSTNEKFYIKVRKQALKYLQKMQISKINQYLSHEKFIIKVFNQRNFDPSIGFYKSNDFSRILEYFFDKQLLKTMSKCKETSLNIKADIKELIDSLNKQAQPVQQQQQPGSIQISLGGSAIATIKPTQNAPRDDLLKVSSDNIAQILLKLIQENDNQDNYNLDDSFYIKQIIKCLGNLDNFKYMPEIAKEIYRQFKLDHIGKFSVQFARTKGAIAAYYSLRKQIYVFNTEKIKYIDFAMEDIQFYQQQIRLTEETLNQMSKDLDSLLENEIWPLEVRFFVASYKIKHCFLYQNNAFLKALFIQLKVIDNFQSQSRIRDATEFTRTLSQFLEKNIERLDFREALIGGERARVIVETFWEFLCLPCNYLECHFTYWLKRVFYIIYGNSPPFFLLLEPGTLQQEQVEFDEAWCREPKKEEAGQQREILKRQMQQKQQTKALVSASQQQKLLKNDVKMSEGGIKLDKFDSKLKIVLPMTEQRAPTQQSWNQAQPQHWGAPFQQPIGESIRISIGNVPLEQARQQKTSLISIPNLGGSSSAIRIQPQASYQDQDMTTPQFSADQQQQLQLMKSISFGKTEQMNLASNNQGSIMRYQPHGDENESVYDEFAEYKFEVDWLQKIWDITGHLWYHEESQAFLEPVRKEDLGEYFEQYLGMIDYPIDLTTIKEKIKDGMYDNHNQWRQDVETMFKNCKAFNEEISDIYQSAIKLERFYYQELKNKGFIDPRATIRIGR